MTLGMKLNEAKKEATMETLLALIQMGKLSAADAAAFAGMSVSAFEEYMDKQRKSEVI